MVLLLVDSLVGVLDFNLGVLDLSLSVLDLSLHFEHELVDLAVLGLVLGYIILLIGLYLLAHSVNFGLKPLHDVF